MRLPRAVQAVRANLGFYLMVAVVAALVIYGLFIRTDQQTYITGVVALFLPALYAAKKTKANGDKLDAAKSALDDTHAKVEAVRHQTNGALTERFAEQQANFEARLDEQERQAQLRMEATQAVLIELLQTHLTPDQDAEGNPTPRDRS